MRKANLEDRPFLQELEEYCFHPDRRESLATISRSLKSPSQEVWIAEENGLPAASMTLRQHKHCLRIYSIAVHPRGRGHGLGNTLLNHAFQRARECGLREVRLEADRDSPDLIRWYTSHGFSPTSVLKDYYGPGTSAVRMRAPVPRPELNRT